MKRKKEERRKKKETKNIKTNCHSHFCLLLFHLSLALIDSCSSFYLSPSSLLSLPSQTLAALLNNLLNQQEVLMGAKGVGMAVQSVVQAAISVHKSPEDQGSRNALSESAQRVSDAIRDLATLAQNVSSAASLGMCVANNERKERTPARITREKETRKAMSEERKRRGDECVTVCFCFSLILIITPPYRYQGD